MPTPARSITPQMLGISVGRHALFKPPAFDPDDGTTGAAWERAEETVGLSDGPFVRSPWGGLCGRMPDATWILDQLQPKEDKTKSYVDFYDVRTPEFYQDVTGGAGWSGELDADQQFKAECAVDILGSDASIFVLDTLAAMLGPTSSGASEDDETGTTCVTSRTLDALVRRVRYRFSTYLDADEDAPQPDDEDEVELALDPSPVVLGLNNGTNPFYKLLYGDDTFLSTRTSKLTSGMDIPTSFAFPLNWSTAVRLCIAGKKIPLVLSDEQRERLHELGETLLDSTSTANNVLSAIQKLKAVGADGAMHRDFGFMLAFGMSGPLSSLVVYLVTTWLRKAASEGLESIGNALIDASQDGLTLNDVASELLWALHQLHTITDEQLDKVFTLLSTVATYAAATPLGWWVFDEELSDLKDTLGELRDAVRDDTGRFLLGLTEDELFRLVVSLPTDTPNLSVLPDLAEAATTLRQPTLHLDPDLFRYAMPASSGAYAGGSEGWYLYFETRVESFGEWLERAGPMLQLAYTLEMASVILEQTFNQESALLSLTGLIADEGLVGAFARENVGNTSVGTVTEIIGDIPVSRLIRYLWRQCMVDKIINALDPTYDEECVYQVFCWMRRETDRDLLDEVLGTVDGAFGVRLFDGLISELFDAVAEHDNSLAKGWATLDCTTREKIQSVIELWDSACINDWAEQAPDIPEEEEDFSFLDVEHIDWAELHTPTYVPIEYMTMNVWDRYFDQPWRDVIRNPVQSDVDFLYGAFSTSLVAQGYQLEALQFVGVRGWTVRVNP